MRNIQTAVSPHPLQIGHMFIWNYLLGIVHNIHLLKYLLFLLKHPVYRYNDCFLPSLGEFIFIQNRINKLTNIRTHSPSSGLNRFCWNLISSWLFISFQLLNSHINIKETRFGYKRFSCIYFSLTNNITPKYIHSTNDRIRCSAYPKRKWVSEGR